MANIHYFQRYSQPENVTTNNTLLLFSRLNHYNQRYFENFLNELLETDLSVGVSISQQKSEAPGTVPDGFVAQGSFKIVLETKRYADFDVAQLERHLASFGNEEKQILMLLSPEKPTESKQKQIRSECQKRIPHLTLAFTTFGAIVQAFNNALQDGRDFEMQDMIEEYESYCFESGLFPTWRFNLRVRTAPSSFDFNLKYNLYYDAINRGFTPHRYFGLFINKSVRAIGKITNIVRANLKDGQLADVESDFNAPVTDEQKQAIIAAIEAAPGETGDYIDSGLRFFLVDRFYPTDFPKTTPYPIRKSKNMNLLYELEMTEKELPESAEEIARLLNGRAWRS